MAALLAELDSVPWSQLAHAYGPAGDVPDLLRALASDDGEDRETALWELFGNIYHQGTIYEATAFAVPFLVELALAKELAGRRDALFLLGAIAESTDGPRTTHDAVARHVTAIADLLTDGDPLVRAGAAYVLGSMGELAETLGPLLRSAAERERDALARAAIVLGIAYLRDSSAENIAWLERRFDACSEERERFATAFALAHAARAATPAPVILLLANACKDPGANASRFRGIPWDVGGETLPGEALVATGTSAYRVLPLLLDALGKASAVGASCLLRDILAIVFGLDAGARSAATLDVRQRQVLQAIADIAIVWEHPRHCDGAFMYYRLPRRRDDLLAWLG